MDKRYDAAILFGIAVILASLIFGLPSMVGGQEDVLRNLEAKGAALCINSATRVRSPCMVLEKPGEERTLYLAVFSADGSELVEVVKQDFTTGKEITLWRKAGPPLDKALELPRYPQKE